MSLRVRSSNPTAATTPRMPKAIRVATTDPVSCGARKSQPSHCGVASAKAANASHVHRCQMTTATAEPVATTRKATETPASPAPTRMGAAIAPRMPSVAIPRASQRIASQVAIAATANASASPATTGTSS